MLGDLFKHEDFVAEIVRNGIKKMVVTISKLNGLLSIWIRGTRELPDLHRAEKLNNFKACFKLTMNFGLRGTTQKQADILRRSVEMSIKGDYRDSSICYSSSLWH